MEMKINRVHTAILFAVLFITVGWIAPAAYTSYAPDSQYIEVHDFNAENATTADDSHKICFDRTVHEPNTGTVFTELSLIHSSGEREEVSTKTFERYFQSGNEEVITGLDLPSDLKKGEYRYSLVVKMSLLNGRVAREFAYTSDSFYITDSNNTTTAEFSC